MERQKANLPMAIRNALGVVGALAIGLIIHNPFAAVGLSFGALMSSFSDSILPYRQRGEHMMAASFFIALMMAVGTQLASFWPLTAIVVAIVGFGAALAICLGASAADIGLAAIVTITVFSARSIPWTDAWQLALAALAGGTIQTALSLLMMPLNPYAPQRKILTDYYRELLNWAAGNYRMDPNADVDGKRLMVPWINNYPSLDDDFSRQGQRVRSLFTQGERIAIQFTRLGGLIQILPPAVKEPSGAMGRVEKAIHSGLATIVAILSDQPTQNGGVLTSKGIFAFDHEQLATELATHGVIQPQIDDLIECLDIIFRQIWIIADIAADAVAARRNGRDPSRPAARYNRKLSESAALIAANLNIRSPSFRHGLRMAAALTVAMLAERWLNLTNSYWLPMTVGLVLKPDFGTTISRGLLRTAGTMVGLILLTWIYALAPETIAAPLIIVGLLMFFLRYFGPMNYGLFAVFISGLIVILLSQSGQHITTLIDARALCTLIGGGIAMAAYCLWPTREETQIAGHIHTLIRSHHKYFLSVIGKFTGEFATAQVVGPSRRAAQLARTNLEASITRLNAQIAVKPGLNRLLSGIMASSSRLFNATASMEAMEITAQRKALIAYCRPLFAAIGPFLTELADVDHASPPTTAPQLVKLLQSLKPPPELLENAIHPELVRIVNSINTLAEQMTLWRELMEPVNGQVDKPDTVIPRTSPTHHAD